MKKENFMFIEEFDPVRKRRMLIKSQSLTGIVPMSDVDSGVWFESALERDFILLSLSDDFINGARAESSPPKCLTKALRNVLSVIPFIGASCITGFIIVPLSVTELFQAD